MNKNTIEILPKGSDKIEDFQFENRTDISRIDIPEGITIIGAGAFMGCNKLSEVTIPSSVKVIGDSAFTSCTLLENVTIKEGAESIGECAFSLCKNLNGIELPLSVKSVGPYAFMGSPCEKDVEEQIKTLKKCRSELEKKEKARIEAERKAKEEYDLLKAPYGVYIEKVSDVTRAMLTCRSIFGWGSAVFREKISSLPIEVSTLEGRRAAEEMLNKLNHGGFAANIKNLEK